jgi:hypothetical protein
MFEECPGLGRHALSLEMDRVDAVVAGHELEYGTGIEIHILGKKTHPPPTIHEIHAVDRGPGRKTEGLGQLRIRRGRYVTQTPRRRGDENPRQEEESSALPPSGAEPDHPPALPASRPLGVPQMMQKDQSRSSSSPQAEQDVTKTSTPQKGQNRSPARTGRVR